jgi:hypothetical protein
VKSIALEDAGYRLSTKKKIFSGMTGTCVVNAALDKGN